MNALRVIVVSILQSIVQCILATLLYGYAYRPYAMSSLPNSDLALYLTFIFPLAIAVAGGNKALHSFSALVRIGTPVGTGLLALLLSLSCAFTLFGT